MAAMSQFPHLRIKKERKKTLVISERWRVLLEFLEFAPRGELKEHISLVVRDVNR
jgi:hypothetical protein